MTHTRPGRDSYQQTRRFIMWSGSTASSGNTSYPNVGCTFTPKPGRSDLCKASGSRRVSQKKASLRRRMKINQSNRIIQGFVSNSSI